MPLFDIFWTMLWLFLWVAWIMMLIQVFADIFRSDMSGWGKALWSLGILILPLIGVLLYLIIHGGDMTRRDEEDAVRAKNASDDYIRSVAGTGHVDVAGQMERLAGLRQQGAISEAEFDQAKTKLLT